MSAISHHLIHVHITLCSRTGLPDHQRKLVVEFSFQDFIAHRSNQPAFFFIQHPQVAVGEGGCFFQVSKGTYNLFRHLIDVLRNGEVHDAALGLCAIVGVNRNLNGSHGVFFSAEGGHIVSLMSNEYPAGRG